ncbi:hypothetical protein C7B67_14390 [filamentous cyanobacterium Phorm 6]|nr:hypothetical protein C7B67_14390 [filamentous cyanobacterium Phorm 6]
MKTLLRLLLKSQHQQNRSHPTQTEKGMTLVELLVGAIMAFLIITPMLAFVVDMLNTDRREQVKSNTEQDLQAAADFIAQDLNQAIYIYDNDGITALNAGNFIPPPNANQTPILVFWKREILKNSLPATTLTPLPKDCDPEALPGTKGECNDTYVLSLVAYYKIKETALDSIWCQPSGLPCPTRIARYQIQDGLKNISGTYFTPDQLKTKGQEKSQAYNGIPSGTIPAFDITKPDKNVTNTNVAWDPEQVLVNYIDYSSNDDTKLPPTECQTALGTPADPKDATKKIDETTLKVTDTDNINSFYACVDTARNTARVTIRGNSLRRLQTNDTAYNPNKSAFFPTASVLVQGLGARGK